MLKNFTLKKCSETQEACPGASLKLSLSLLTSHLRWKRTVSRVRNQAVWTKAQRSSSCCWFRWLDTSSMPVVVLDSQGLRRKWRAPLLHLLSGVSIL